MKTKIKNSNHLNILGNDNSLSNREILTASLKSWWQKFGYFSMFTALPTIMTSFAQEAQAEETKKPEMSISGQNVKLLQRLKKPDDKPKFLQNLSNYRLPFEKGKFDIVSELAGGDNCPGKPILAGTYSYATPFTDSGDTTGANNTVNSICSPYCYYTHSAAGPDQIYSFTLSGVGSNPRILVSATSANYDPAIYILYGNNSCPTGTGNNLPPTFVLYASSSGGTETLDLSSLPLNVPLYLFIDSASNGANSSGSYNIRIRDVGIAPAPPPPPTVQFRQKFDFDGDFKADLSVFRPADRTWYLNQSTYGSFTRQFGLSTDKITPADYDRDGRTDFSVFRDGTWYRINSDSFPTTVSVVQFGLPNDIPVPADYTGDRRDDIAVYRGGTWWIFNVLNQQVSTIQFGLPTDIPVPADYDGDGRADQAVFRNGEWHLNRSTQGYTVVQWGLATDKPVPADYDGDGKTDLAVYRNGTWYIQRSNQGYLELQWGFATDVPAPADYDGDGNADAAVFRNGTWYLLQSTSGISTQQFGLPNDKPVPAAYLP